jgi:ABC-2 type transport system permease protein
MFTGIGAFSNAIRNEQLTGTIEAILMSPTRLSTIIILTGIWSFIYSTLIVLIYFVIGSLFFNLTINWLNLPVCLLILIPSIVIFSSLGIISASFVFVFKRGDPIKWFFSMGASFLSGAFFPTDIFSQRLQFLSKFIPTTYSLRALRLALLKNASFSNLLPEFLILVLFCLIFMPISIFIFKLAVKRVKKEGALAYY